MHPCVVPVLSLVARGGRGGRHSRHGFLVNGACSSLPLALDVGVWPMLANRVLADTMHGCLFYRSPYWFYYQLYGHCPFHTDPKVRQVVQTSPSWATDDPGQAETPRFNYKLLVRNKSFLFWEVTKILRVAWYLATADWYNIHHKRYAKEGSSIN